MHTQIQEKPGGMGNWKVCWTLHAGENGVSLEGEDEDRVDIWNSPILATWGLSK